MKRNPLFPDWPEANEILPKVVDECLGVFFFRTESVQEHNRGEKGCMVHLLNFPKAIELMDSNVFVKQKKKQGLFLDSNYNKMLRYMAPVQEAVAEALKGVGIEELEVDDNISDEELALIAHDTFNQIDSWYENIHGITLKELFRQCLNIEEGS